MLALPVFPLVAWYVRRSWPQQAARAGLTMIGGALFLAGIVEPAWELSTGATREWAFGASRLWALATYTALGIAAFVVTLHLLRRRPVSKREAAAG